MDDTHFYRKTCYTCSLHDPDFGIDARKTQVILHRSTFDVIPPYYLVMYTLHTYIILSKLACCRLEYIFSNNSNNVFVLGADVSRVNKIRFSHLHIECCKYNGYKIYTYEYDIFNNQ